MIISAHNRFKDAYPRERVHGDLADRAQAQSEDCADMQLAGISAQLAKAGCADCTDCGAHIPDARRQALPSATRCAQCQGMAEAKKQNINRWVRAFNHHTF